jgi:competence protein ComEA
MYTLARARRKTLRVAKSRGRCSRMYLGIVMSSRMLSIAWVLFGSAVWAQLPDGPGKVETERVCKQCHEIERSIAPRQDREAWQSTMDKMVALGARLTDQEYATILDYLVKHYPAPEMPKLNVNKASAIDLESRLSLLRSQAAAIIEYRTKHGDFKSIDDLKKVPGVDAAKIEARKDQLTF